MGPLQSHISALSFPIVLTGDAEPIRFVSVLGTQTGDGDGAIGVTRNGEVAGRAVTVDAVGVFDMVSGAAIAKGAEVQSDADGLPITKAAGSVNGLALTAAINPGDIVKILIK